MGDRPTLPPPRLRPKNPASADSFPAVTKDEGERLWKVLARIEKRLDDSDRERGRDLKRHVELEERIDEHDEQIEDLIDKLDGASELAKSTEQLSNEVRALLNRDADQEKRLAQIEIRSVRAGEQAGTAAGVTAGAHAGHRAGGKWAGIMTLVGILVGSAISTGIQQCSAETAKAAHHPGQ